METQEQVDEKSNKGTTRFDGHISVAQFKNIHTNRGRVAFSNTAEDPNHTIYNNGRNIDSEGAWDGMKINCFAGLDIRTGDARFDQQATVLKVDNDGVEAKKFKGAIQLANVTDVPSVACVGAMRYREEANVSYVEVCMRINETKYKWVVVNEQSW